VEVNISSDTSSESPTTSKIRRESVKRASTYFSRAPAVTVEVEKLDDYN
jgi:hypothetical protein